MQIYLIYSAESGSDERNTLMYAVHWPKWIKSRHQMFANCHPQHLMFSGIYEQLYDAKSVISTCFDRGGNRSLLTVVVVESTVHSVKKNRVPAHDIKFRVFCAA